MMKCENTRKYFELTKRDTKFYKLGLEELDQLITENQELDESLAIMTDSYQDMRVLYDEAQQQLKEQKELVEIKKIVDEAIEAIEDNRIYDHGYPESRLVPADHYEKAEQFWMEEVKDKVSEIVERILSDYKNY